MSLILNTCENEFDEVLSHGNAVMLFVRNEQYVIQQLNNLQKFVSDPNLKETFEKCDMLTKTLDEITSYHENLYENVVLGCHALNIEIRSLPLYLEKQYQFSSIVLSNLSEIQMSSDRLDFNPSLELLSQVSCYEKLLQKLSISKPENQDYIDVLLAVQKMSEKLRNESSLKKNTMTVLKLQQLLKNRQPKILSPRRRFLKKGVLYKVNYKRSKMKRRIFMLFDDMLLCCKVRVKHFDWQHKDSLKCVAVLPLSACSINFTSSSEKGNVFKVKCMNMSFLLMSKIPGEAQSWILELQSAIRQCRNSIETAIVRKDTKQSENIGATFALWSWMTSC